jgi:hypothetical protein
VAFGLFLPTDRHHGPRLIADDFAVALASHGNRTWLPDDVIELPGRKTAEVIFPRDDIAKWADELKIISMQPSRRFDIAGDKGGQPLVLDSTDGLHRGSRSNRRLGGRMACKRQDGHHRLPAGGWACGRSLGYRTSLAASRLRMAEHVLCCGSKS